MYTAALIGCGRIGYSLGLDKKREQPASHTMALNDNSHIKIIAGCDKNSLTLRTWHEANKKALVYTDSADFYARSKADIVVIAVNESDHEKEAVAALRAKPRLVILEKPVALNIKQAEFIKKIADVNEVPVIVNHERRFAQDFILAKAYMSKIGELQSINAKLSSSMVVYNPEEEFTGGYSLIHDGTHLVDAVLFFLERDLSGTKQIQKKSCVVKKSSGLLNSASSVKVQTETKTVSELLNSPVISGIYRDEKNCVRQFSAHYSTSVCPDVTISMSGRSKFFAFEIIIDGTLGRICIGNGYLKFYQRQKSNLYTGFYSLANDKSVHIPKKTQYFSNMVQNAVDFLDEKAPLKSTLQTGINALAVLEEIKEKLI